MTPGQIGLAARNDDLIVKFGMNFLGPTKHVSQKMREMGRLLIEVREHQDP